MQVLRVLLLTSMPRCRSAAFCSASLSLCPLSRATVTNSDSRAFSGSSEKMSSSSVVSLELSSVVSCFSVACRLGATTCVVSSVVLSCRFASMTSGTRSMALMSLLLSSLSIVTTTVSVVAVVASCRVSKPLTALSRRLLTTVLRPLNVFPGKRAQARRPKIGRRSRT
ncbi:Vmc-like lipoprotein signal peptide domain-containing protein [Streptomyces sp. NPDC006971]|uniref:Vmc-like lipoprotein signal peptide domain-containing protein n=1 Tax=Streptomyces sp. NPDC006971 TaxID=3154784 RepID=UPI0034117E50